MKSLHKFRHGLDTVLSWVCALLFAAMVIGSVLAGAIWAFVPAWFKSRWNTNETLFTLMMNYVATSIVACMTNIMRGQASSLGTLNKATKAGWLPVINGTRTSTWVSAARPFRITFTVVSSTRSAVNLVRLMAAGSMVSSMRPSTYPSGFRCTVQPGPISNRKMLPDKLPKEMLMSFFGMVFNACWAVCTRAARAVLIRSLSPSRQPPFSVYSPAYRCGLAESSP